MSLITLNSNGQEPFFYSTHFPQPIKIEPYSQVCLLKFLHFRDGSVFNITNMNNVLMYFIGNTLNDAIRIARIQPGQYSGPELATEIENAMNNVCQQQHYNFTCTHIPEDDTTAPPTLEGFSISFASLPQPLSGVLSLKDGNGGTTNFDYSETSSSSSFRLKNDLTLNPLLNTLINNKGVLTHLGNIQIKNIGFDLKNQEASDRENIDNFGFNDCDFGIVRNELSDINNTNDNLIFNTQLQDVFVSLSVDGITIGTVDINGNTKPGNPKYATQRICRTISSTTLKRLITVPVDKDINDLPSLRLLFILNLSGENRRVIVQMKVSYDGGLNYIDLNAGILGNDTQNNPYNDNFTDGAGNIFNSAIWVSDNSKFNDVNAKGQNLAKQNVIITKKAPYKATITMNEINQYYGIPNFTESGLTFNTSAASKTPNAVVTISDYTGDNNYDYKVEITGGSTYYLISKLKLPSTSSETSRNPNLFRASNTDVPYADGTTIDATFNYQNQVLTVLDTPNEVINKISSKDIKNRDIGLTNPSFNNFECEGILNPNDRPLTLMNINDGSQFDSEIELSLKHFSDLGIDKEEHTETVSSGADLSRKVGLFLRQLNVNDIASNSAGPANLRQGQSSGNIGSTIGSIDNFILTSNASTGTTLFTSTQSVQKVAKDSIIRVAIPEFSGLKSFQGIDKGAGKNLSGVGKDLAILPKEEFTQLGESVQNSLVYVAPFENWIDINNGQELYLNQLTVEIRQPEGQFASDLRPDSIAQIKIRKDPNKEAEQNIYRAFNRAVLESSSSEKTGQILSANIYNKGS